MTDQTMVNNILNWMLHNGAALTQPTSPLHLRLMSTAGSNTSNGTELVAGSSPGYTALGNTMGSPSFGAASAGQVSSANAVSWTATGAWQTVNGVEVWDTAGTPVRLLQGSITAITGATTNDVVQFAAASVVANASTW